jgi:hypothetical protein
MRITGAEDGAAAARLDRPLLALTLYAGATVALTFPLAMHLGSRLPLGAGDIWSNLWNFWWWKTALFELGTSPYHTDYLFHPHGISLAFHTHSPLNVVATLPISLLFGIEAAYDAALLAGFWLGGFFTYLLVRDLTGEPRAAFVAGLIFAFAPAHFEQSLEHLNLASVEFIPLFVFFMRRLLLHGGPGNAVGTGFSFAANALVCWQYGFLAVPAGAALIVRGWLAHGTRRSPGRVGAELALAVGAAGVLVLPFAAPMLREMLGASGLPFKPFDVLGTDPVFWLLPSDHHPVFGPLTETLYRARRAYPFAGFLSYLGFIPVGLALAALTLHRGVGEDRWFWGAWTALFLALSLGAHPIVFGRLYPEISLPHALFEGVPLLRMLRTANRFHSFAMLGIAVLAGAGLAALFRKGRARAAWILAAVATLEYLWLPYPTQPAGVHPFLDELARDREAGAVLPVPLPLGSRHARALHDQTRHRLPIVGGYTSYADRDAIRSIKEVPFLMQSALGGPRPVPLEPDRLRALGVGTVLVHLDRSQARYRERQEAAGDDYYARRAHDPQRGFATHALDSMLRQFRLSLGPPLHEDDLIAVFRVPHR